jgi:arylsulfatase A-like enzyme
MSIQFKGSIGRTWQDSKAWWPQPSCYGDPIDTPNIDKIAANGLLYNNWHTTALCGSTRACLLTGHNHHSVGMAAVTNIATGFPGYQ